MEKNADSRSLSYQTTGTCSRMIDVTIGQDGIVEEVRFTGGCHGNTQGLAALIRGMKASEAIARLKGIRCKDKPTSCPDQLALALESMVASGETVQ